MKRALVVASLLAFPLTYCALGSRSPEEAAQTETAATGGTAEAEGDDHEKAEITREGLRDFGTDAEAPPPPAAAPAEEPAAAAEPEADDGSASRRYDWDLGVADKKSASSTSLQPQANAPAAPPVGSAAGAPPPDFGGLAELQRTAPARPMPKPAPKAKADVEQKLRSREAERSERAPAKDEKPRDEAAAKEEWREAFANLEVTDPARFRDMFFQHFGTNPTIETVAERFSTFSVDVDNAAYTLARSYLDRGAMPPEAAVRVEEIINYFDYAYEPPRGDEAFSVNVEAYPSPNRKGYHVLHVGLKGKEVHRDQRKRANLVFVIDVSGSMAQENRLGLVKRSLALLVDQMDAHDSVGIVVYGTSAHAILAPTSGRNKERIHEAIARLQPEGSTNAQAGIELGYQLAAQQARKGDVNRVILCSDGVANNGITDADGIFARIKDEASRGITVSTIGFGMGNYNDVLMERLANIGDGNYYYVDDMKEARRVFVENLTGTLQVIAKDVKVQVEFDPDHVERYRLLGYENRHLDKQDFANDRVDAGEIGAGHQVTALYEVKFTAQHQSRGHFGTLRLRHKAPEGGASRLIEKALPYAVVRGELMQSSAPARLALASAGYAEKLRGSYWARNLSYQDIQRLIESLPPALKSHASVVELARLVGKAAALDQRGDKWASQAPIANMSFDRVPRLD